MSLPSTTRVFLLSLLLLTGVPARTGTIGPDELRPGMTGWGLSVFGPSGSIDTFQVELVDVMRGVSPGGDMLLCRLSGQGLEHSGIVAGMSGSPVYFEGRLAGAVAYGWGFAKDPLAGVTPIGEMLEVLQLPDRDPGTGRAGMINDRQPAFGGPTPVAPLPVPLGIAGASPGLLALAGSMLEGSGLMPVPAGRAGPQTREPTETELRPGSAVGVVLADGDVRYAATGTVTWVERDRLLAFGHPMFLAGTVALPLSAGVVHAVMPSYLSSFKLSSAGPPMGSFIEDRLPAVSGIIGPVPDMFPVRVRLETPNRKQEYAFRVAQFEPLLPVLVALGVAEVVYATEAWEEMTLEARVRLKPAGLPAVSYRQTLADRAPADLLARSLRDRLAALTRTGFEPVRLESLELLLKLRPGLHRVTVTGVRPARSRVAPGDSLSLFLEMRDEQGRASTRTVGLRIPEVTPPGRLTLFLASSDSFLLRESYRAPAALEPRSRAELFQLLARTGDEDVLVIAGYSGAAGLTLAGRELPLAPPTLRRLAGSGPTRPTGESLVFTKRVGLDAVVAGSHEIVLEVRK